MPGPIPKLSSARRRRNKIPDLQQIDVERPQPVAIPRLPRSTHAIARRWYRSLKESGQSELFEPSDWAAALFVAEAMTRLLDGSGMSSRGFTAIWSAMSELLTTEGARRRVHVEIQRHGRQEESDSEPDAIAGYRERLGK